MVLRHISVQLLLLLLIIRLAALCWFFLLGLVAQVLKPLGRNIMSIGNEFRGACTNLEITRRRPTTQQRMEGIKLIPKGNVGINYSFYYIRYTCSLGQTI